MSTTETPAPKKQIKISDVLAMLEAGQDRKAIAKYYGISMATAKEKLFSHPLLLNKKVKRIDDSLEIIDDTPGLASKSDGGGSTKKAKANAAAATTSTATASPAPAVQESAAPVQQAAPATTSAAPAASADQGEW